MSVILRHADLFTSQAEALINPVNCVGVMGRGLALTFSRRHPEILDPYRTACRTGDIRPGRVFIHQLTHQRPGDPVYIIHFPTKRHWRDPSRIEDITAGLTDLAARCRAAAIRSIAVPALGCGLGGLPWTAVSTLIDQTFAPATTIECELHPPAHALQRA